MLALAWIFALVGAAVAWVISLAGAMSTVPQLHWQDALYAIPLPVVAAGLAGSDHWERDGGSLPRSPSDSLS